MSEPTPSQALVLFGLLARHGACKQAELMPAVKKADREALVKARLIEVAKEGRGLLLRLEDAGWAWAGAHLSAELPPAQRALQDMLTRLGEHLARSRETLAGFIGSKPAEAARQKPDTPPRRKAAGSRSPTSRSGRKAIAPPPRSDREMIVDAYRETTGDRTGVDVRLSALRAKLPGMDRGAFDAALTEMHLDGCKARLMRIEDQRSLTAADRDAALQFKGNAFHVLWIEA